MKTIENTLAFGNFKPGDQLCIPDEADFDHFHFAEVVENPEPTPVEDDSPVKTDEVPLEDTSDNTLESEEV